MEIRISLPRQMISISFHFSSAPTNFFDFCPDNVGPDLLGLADHVASGDLGAQVVHLVAVVRQDDVDEVLADVVNVTPNGGEDDLALAPLVGPFWPYAAPGTRRPTSSPRRTGGRTAVACGRRRKLADGLHAIHQGAVHDIEGGHPRVQGLP